MNVAIVKKGEKLLDIVEPRKRGNRCPMGLRLPLCLNYTSIFNFLQVKQKGKPKKHKEWRVKFVEKAPETVEKAAEKVYNTRMKSSGAVYGAWNDKNDPDEIHRRKHAEQYYESVRNRSTVHEVARIAKHTGFVTQDVQAIYEHVFENYYELEGGSKRFDPDYDMAQSWDRLFSGKNIQKHDITLLHHELMESRLMADGMDYDTAHKMTQKKHDYLSELIKWKIERGDL